MNPTVDVIQVLANTFKISFEDPNQAQRLAKSVSDMFKKADQANPDDLKQAEFISGLVVLLKPMVHGILSRLLTRFTFGEQIEEETLLHDSTYYSQLIANQLWGIGQCQCLQHIQRMGVIGKFNNERIQRIWQQRHDQWHHLASWNFATHSLDYFLSMAISNEGKFTRVQGVSQQKEFIKTSNFFKKRALHRGVAESMLVWQVESEDGVRLRRVPMLCCQECKSPLSLKNRCSCHGFSKSTTVESHFIRDEERLEYEVYECEVCRIEVYPESKRDRRCGICSNELSGRASHAFPEKRAASLLKQFPKQRLEDTDESLDDAELVESGAAGEFGSSQVNAISVHLTTAKSDCDPSQSEDDTDVEVDFQTANSHASDTELAAKVVNNFAQFTQLVRARFLDEDSNVLDKILKLIRERFERLTNPEASSVDFDIYKENALNVQRNKRELFDKVLRVLSAWIADLPEGGKL